MSYDSKRSVEKLNTEKETDEIGKKPAHVVEKGKLR